MVNIAAGVAEARVEMTVATVVAIVVRVVRSVVPNYTRPVLRFLSQGRTSLSAVPPDASYLNGGLAVA